MRNKTLLFTCSFIIPFIVYRLYVLMNDGRVSYLRGLTGWQVHHYHYGVILSLAGMLLLLFYGISAATTIISGLGAGAMLDSFVSSLFVSTTRADEIINYQANLLPTAVLFAGVILVVILLRKVR